MDFLGIRAARLPELEETPDERPREREPDTSCNPSEKDASKSLPPGIYPRSRGVGDASYDVPHREPSQTVEELQEKASAQLAESADVRRTGQPAYLDLSLLPRRDQSMGLFCQFQTGESSSRSAFNIPRGSRLSPSPSSPAIFRSPTAGRRSPTTQLTMFYAGSVHVYDVPAETAKAVMRLAASSATPAPNFNGSISFAPTTPMSCTPRGTGVQSRAGSLVPDIQTLEQAELPVHRKQSLQRFLEKRKDRLSSNAPHRAPVAPH